MKYKEWLEEWMNYHSKSYLKARTCRNYESIIKNHILPYIGDYELNDLNYSILHNFIIDRQQNGKGRQAIGLAAGTVDIIINVLQKMWTNFLSFSDALQ